MKNLSEHPAAVAPSKIAMATDPLYSKPNEKMLPKSKLDYREAKDLISKASPLPWRCEFGRMSNPRFDMLSAAGELVLHAHPVPPFLVQNWIADFGFIIHLTQIIKAQEEEIERLETQFKEKTNAN